MRCATRRRNPRNAGSNPQADQHARGHAKSLESKGGLNLGTTSVKLPQNHGPSSGHPLQRDLTLSSRVRARRRSHGPSNDLFARDDRHGARVRLDATVRQLGRRGTVRPVSATPRGHKGSIGHLNGLNLLIDTGTIPSVVDTRIARKLQLQTASTHLSFGQQVSIRALLDGLSIGALQSGPVPAGVSDLSYLRRVRVDAIVGLDVLARRSFSIDYRTIC